MQLKNFKLNELEGVKLKQCACKRNSNYNMFERIVQIKESLISALTVYNYSQFDSLPQVDFNIIENICKTLKPFRYITNEVNCKII